LTLQSDPHLFERSHLWPDSIGIHQVTGSS
jgi:hypothetical protein